MKTSAISKNLIDTPAFMSRMRYLLLYGFFIVSGSVASAAPAFETWNAGSTGTWDAISNNWATGTTTGTGTTWTTGNDAIFNNGGNTAVAIQAAGISADSVQSYTNGTNLTLNGGTLTLTSASSSNGGPGTAGSVAFLNTNNSATIDVNSNIVMGATAGSTQYIYNAGGQIEVNGNMSDAGVGNNLYLTNNGFTRVDQLNGAISLAGTTGITINAGGGTTGLYNLGGNITLSGTGAQLDLADSGSGSLGALYLLGGTNTINNGVDLQYGVLGVSNSASLGGALEFNGGTSGNASGALLVTGSNFTSFAGTTVTFGSNANTLIAVAQGSTFNVNVTLTGGSGHNGDFDKYDAGNLTISGNANSYNRWTELNGGTTTLDYSTYNNNKISSANNFYLGGDNLVLNGGSFAQTVGNTTLGVTLQNGSNQTMGGASSISQTSGSSTIALGALSQKVGNTLDVISTGVASTTTGNTNGILGPWATFGSGTSMQYATGGGTIAGYSGATALPATGGSATANYTLNSSGQTLTSAESAYTLQYTGTGGGGILALNGNSLTLNGLLNTGTDGLTISGTGSLTIGAAAGVAQNELIFTGPGNTTISSIISGGGALTDSSSGTLSLVGTNTYTGNTYLNAGTLAINSDSSLGAAGTGASVYLDGGALQEISGTGALTLDNAGSNKRNIVLGPNGGTINVQGTDALTIDGNITGYNINISGGLTKTGTGTLVLTSGSNTFNGGVFINGGTIQLGNSGALGGGAASLNTVAFGASSNGNLALNGNNITILGLTGDTTSKVSDGASGGATLDIMLSGANDTFAGSLVNGSTGALGLTKDGAGTLILTGANSYTGATTIIAGSIELGNGTTDGTLTGNTTITATGLGGIIFNNINSETFGGVISGIGPVTKSASGTQTLTGVSNYTGSTTITAGVLAIGGAGQLGSGTYAGNISNAGGFSYGSSAATTISGVISGTGSLVEAGPGTLTLSGSNTYTGVTYFNGGVLSVSNLATEGSGGGVASGLGASGNAAGNLIFNGGALTYTGSGTTTDRNFTIDAGGATLNGSGSGAITFSGTASYDVANQARSLAFGGNNQTNVFSGLLANNGTGALSLTMNGSNTWDLTGSNTFTGSITLNSGTLAAGTGTGTGYATGATPFGNAAPVTLNGGTLYFNSSTGGGTIYSTIFNNPITVSSAATIYQGDGNNILTGALNVNSALTLRSSFNNKTMNFNGALTGTGSITVVAGNFASQQLNFVFSGSNTTYSGMISETSTGGSGTQIVLANNTALQNATLNLNGSTTTVSQFGATYTNTDLIFAGAGTSNPNSGNFFGTATTSVTAPVIGALAGNSNLILQTTDATPAAVILTAGGNNSSTTYSGVASGPGGLTKAGTGTMTLTGSNSYVGTTTVNAGTLALGSTGFVSSTSIVVNSPGIYDLSQVAGTVTYGDLSGSGTVALGADTLTLGDTSTTTFSGSINDGGIALGTGASLIYNGTGMFTLGGLNGYTGATTINGGTLALGINNAINSASTLEVGGTAAGTFAMNGFNDSVAGVSLDNGSSITGSGTLTSASTYLLQYGTVSAVLAGTQGAKIDASGETVVLSGANTFTGTTTVSANAIVNYRNGTAFGTYSPIVVSNFGSVQVQGGIAGGSQALTLRGTGPTGSNGALENISGNNSFGGAITLTGATTFASDTGSLTLTGGITNGGNTLTVKGPGSTVIGTGAITGLGGVTTSGSASLTLTGSNTYSGATSIGSGSTLQLGNGTTTGALSTSSAITDNGTFIVDRSNAVAEGTDFASGISGGGSLQQIGSGAVTLGVANTYSGGTTIANGSTLVVANASGSATGSGTLTMGAGATLAGTGASSGSSFNISGTSGNKAKVLVGQTSVSDTTYTNNLVLTGSTSTSTPNTLANVNLNFNLNAQVAGGLGGTANGGAGGALGVANSGNELSVGGSDIAFGSSVNSVTLTLNIQSQPAIIPAYTPYVLIAGTGVTNTLAGTSTGQYAGLTLGATTMLPSGATETVITGTNLSLIFPQAVDNTYYAANSQLVLYQSAGVDDIDVVVVPEPGTWALMLGGLVSLIFIQRRKNKAKENR